MPDTRTAVSCPEHGRCVVTFISCLESELGDRVKIKLPAPYQPWVDQLGRVVVAVEHSPAEVSPNAQLAALIAGKRNAERDLLNARLDRLEGFVTRKKRWRKAWDKTDG